MVIAYRFIIDALHPIVIPKRHLATLIAYSTEDRFLNLDEGEDEQASDDDPPPQPWLGSGGAEGGLERWSEGKQRLQAEQDGDRERHRAVVEDRQADR